MSSLAKEMKNYQNVRFLYKIFVGLPNSNFLSIKFQVLPNKNIGKKKFSNLRNVNKEMSKQFEGIDHQKVHNNNFNAEKNQ
jgi:hypothetical protein